MNAPRHETPNTTIHKSIITDKTVINRPNEIPKPRNRRYGNLWDVIACYWLVIGFVHIYQSSSKHGRTTENDLPDECGITKTLPWKIRFQAAQWLTSKGFTIWSTACFGDWQYHYRPHRLRPKDAPIFEACRKGNVESVRESFLKGEASPFDIDEKNRTPLHVSAQQDITLTPYGD